MTPVPSRYLAVLPAVALFATAGCTAQLGPRPQRGPYDDLRVLVLEQRDAIDDLRLEQERLRAAVDELRFVQQHSALGNSPVRGGAVAETAPYYPGGRQPTPAIGGPNVAGVQQPGQFQQFPPPDDADDSGIVNPAPARSYPAPPGSTPPPPAVAQAGIELPTVPTSLAGSAYEDGIRALIGGDPDTAIQNLRDFLRNNGRSGHADDAQFWIAEAYFRKGQNHRAIIEFNQVAVEYPKGDRAPAALLRQAEIFRIVGDRVDARLNLQKVLQRYPGTPEAERATRMLAELEG